MFGNQRVLLIYDFSKLVISYWQVAVHGASYFNKTDSNEVVLRIFHFEPSGKIGHGFCNKFWTVQKEIIKLYN